MNSLHSEWIAMRVRGNSRANEPHSYSLDRYDIELDEQYDEILGKYPRKPWSRFITSGGHLRVQLPYD